MVEVVCRQPLPQTPGFASSSSARLVISLPDHQGLHPHRIYGELHVCEHLRLPALDNSVAIPPIPSALRPKMAATMTSADFSLQQYRRPFRHEARSPQVRAHSFTAQPPDLRHFALITRASWLLAHSPCSAAPSIRFLSIGSQFMLHASSPRSVALTQLRFTSFAVINLRRDLHPQECAHAGRTDRSPLAEAS